MKITRHEVERVAVLARLALTDKELDAMTGQMNQLLDYVDTLNRLDTDGIVPTAHAVPVENAFRDDVVRPSIGSERALMNAPAAADNYFRVPKIIE
ncbi:MAG: Asp-tRNA(Asn)/Glu-tRNA(Gln) amidotransferase subunit GatC [Desulfuromonadales bacterium]|nr:Asp-tRNA(Asn)/Glu-tRNA(Gln) amidotransferase subunit GatC [Desulfuromonadales bacterium]